MDAQHNNRFQWLPRQNSQQRRRVVPLRTRSCWRHKGPLTLVAKVWAAIWSITLHDILDPSCTLSLIVDVEECSRRLLQIHTHVCWETLPCIMRKKYTFVNAIEPLTTTTTTTNKQQPGSPHHTCHTTEPTTIIYHAIRTPDDACAH